MKVVTGATGHLGNVLVRQLLQRQEKVRAIIMEQDKAQSLAELPVDRFIADIRDLESLTQAFRGADTVFHLAGIVTVMPGQQPLLRQVNIEGTRNVIKACLANGVRRLVYTSSVHAIVEPPHGVAMDETYPFDPHRVDGDYGRSKAAASLAVLAGVQMGLDAVIACPSGIIGPFDYQPSIVGRLLINAAQHKMRFYVSGGYDFVDVRDVAQGIIAASERGQKGKTYILAGQFITVRTVIDIVAEIMGHQPLDIHVPLPLALAASRWAERLHLLPLLGDNGAQFTQQSLSVLQSNGLISHAKATRELGYQPRPIAETITDTLHWFRTRQMLA